MISPYSISIVRNYLKFSIHTFHIGFSYCTNSLYLSSYSLSFKIELQHYPVKFFCFHILQSSLLFHLLSSCYFVITIVASNWFLYPMLCYAKSLQSCPTLCDPIDSSPPGSPIPGILQARTLEWVAISFSNTWKWKGKGNSFSRVRLSATPWTAAYQAPPSMGFSRQEYWSGVPLPSPFSILGLTICSI